MLLPLAAAFSVLRPMAFPEAPIRDEVLRGAAVYVAGKGIERVLLEDRAVLGLWFDGRIRRDVEDVVWVSPGLVARWLGYLEAQEKWPRGVLEARWRAVRSELEGTLLLVVRLSAFPRTVDPEFGLPGGASPDEVENVRFAFTAGGNLPRAGSARDVATALRQLRTEPSAGGLNLPLRPNLVRRGQARSWRAFEDVPWTSLVRVGDLLWPEFDIPPAPAHAVFGNFHAAWYVLQLPVPEGLRAEPAFELRVFSPEKERVGRFPLVRQR